MAKRNRNAPPPPEVPAGIVAVFFVIALVVAFAKVLSGPTHSYAGNPTTTHVA